MGEAVLDTENCAQGGSECMRVYLLMVYRRFFCFVLSFVLKMGLAARRGGTRI